MRRSSGLRLPASPCHCFGVKSSCGISRVVSPFSIVQEWLRRTHCAGYCLNAFTNQIEMNPKPIPTASMYEDLQCMDGLKESVTWNAGVEEQWGDVFGLVPGASKHARRSEGGLIGTRRGGWLTQQPALTARSALKAKHGSDVSPTSSDPLQLTDSQPVFICNCALRNTPRREYLALLLTTVVLPSSLLVVFFFPLPLCCFSVGGLLHILSLFTCKNGFSPGMAAVATFAATEGIFHGNIRSSGSVV